MVSVLRRPPCLSARVHRPHPPGRPPARPRCPPPRATGCDALNCIVGLLTMASTLQLGPTWKTMALIVVTYTSFFMGACVPA